MLRRNKSLLLWAGILLVVNILIQWFADSPERVESLYSRGFYPYFQNIPKILFDFIPFSIGDVIYLLILFWLIYLIASVFGNLFRRRFQSSLRAFLMTITSILSLYLCFHIEWSLNYYRVPLSKQFGLNVDTILLEDHLRVLDEHIVKANRLRDSVDITSKSRKDINLEIERLMMSDSEFYMLSKKHIQVKSPLASKAISYLGTSGYLNPFTNEAHVNVDMPVISYPFTVAHELAHQMGVGFEDECNYVAFVMLSEQEDSWFQYAAYYESLQYLLRSLYLIDVKLFEQRKNRLSPKIRRDMVNDQEYWKNYTGWTTKITSMFYDQYLKHNNQLEGMNRYGLVSKLIIASELKNGL